MLKLLAYVEHACGKSSTVAWRQPQRLPGSQLDLPFSLNCHSSGSLLAGISNSQSGEITARLDWSQQLDLLWKCWNCCSTSAHFGRIDAVRRLNPSFLKSLAASWAFVHFGRQLVHNKCDSGEYCENKSTVVFRPKMMCESSCYKRDEMIPFAFHNVFPVVRLVSNTYRRGPLSVAALLLCQISAEHIFSRGQRSEDKFCDSV